MMMPNPKPLWLRRMKTVLPRSLFGRTLLIIVTPTVLALSLATFVFFDRHWSTLTHRLTYAVAGDVAIVLELIRNAPDDIARRQVIALAYDKLDNIRVDFMPDAALPNTPNRGNRALTGMLKDALADRLTYPFLIDLWYEPRIVSIMVAVPEGVYRFLLPERRLHTPTTEAFIAWMIGSSILLSIIALLFMRNQIRPIRRLADAAEAIGKGQDAPFLKPEGAAEVRQATAAVLVMRDRLRRQVIQRTAMLAGVSHDLRTPLTRMRLQLALMPQDEAIRELKADVTEMEAMIEAYLAFARGEEAEQPIETDIAILLQEICDAAERQQAPGAGKSVTLAVDQPVLLTIRRNAMKRCLANLVSNALRYASNVTIALQLRDHAADIIVDDNGPGIAPERREDVFRPFLRLDESRNASTGGIGLGLTIARDIARAHGGDIMLADSPLGGLRARLWLPV
jgi:two-component system osmolarity sensor histidine kinase EnvZ